MKNKITRCTYFFFLFLGISSSLNANQYIELKTTPAKNQPASYQIKGKLLPAPKVIANQANMKSIQIEDEKRSLEGLPYRFAVPVKAQVEFTQQGLWTEHGDKSIWRLNVSGEHVQSFNIGLKNVFLPQHAKLFFYSDNYDSLVGPYTHKDNKSHRELWSPVMESNSVTIEINVPTKYKSLVKFNVAAISQGYRSIRSAEMAKSGSCNNDVVCTEADPWRDEIRSVARYTITVGASSFFCTGTLINNVEDNLTPYFLTAGHCQVDSTSAASITTYWNYETSVCQGTPNGQLNQFQTGTTFLAGTYDPPSSVVGSDFAIVQLDSTPDSSFNVYWAGWDNSGNTVNSSVGIHHPAGDEKRISFDNDPLTVTNYSNTSANANGTHLMVGAWEDGTTEGGSSGSGLWDENHRIVGTLSGGGASCQALDQPDWYGRFATHWVGDGTSTGQLKVWLDPNDTGAETANGRNACDAPTVTITTSPATGNMGESIAFVASATGGTAPYTYSWDFNSDSTQDSTGDSTSYTYNYLYQGNLKVTATDATDCPGSDTAAIVISNSGDELFMGDGQIPGDWQQTAGSNASWSPDTTETFDGATSLASQVVTDEQSSSIEVTQTFQGSDNFIAFAYKVSSEAGFDKLNFSVDGVVKGSWSGEVDWGTAYVSLDEGTYTLKWSYDKDQSVSSGQDKAWIDGVTGIVLASGNQLPTASVAQASISANENTSVTLDASSSNDPDGDTLTFSWTQTNGTTVALTNADTATATFTTPNVSVSTELQFLVTVSDPSGGQSEANVTVTVTGVNEAPTASVAQTSINADENTSVTLDATSSSDPDSDTLTFSWSQTSGTTVTLSNADTATATFTAPSVSASTDLQFSVTVSDPSGEQSEANVTVTVADVPVVEPPEGGSSGGGVFGFSIFGLLLLLRRKAI